MSPTDHLNAVLLFLAIPAVLVLFLRQPLGPAASVLIGMAIMFGHRFVAAPFARRHAGERCAWCGGRATPAFSSGVDVEAGAETWRLVTCSEAHRSRVARFLSLLYRWRAPLAAGIFLPLALLLVGSLARAAGWPFISHGANALQFRVIVAVTVVSASVGYLVLPQADERLRCPFPLHNLLLLGIRQTLWIFRLVGAWWIVDGIRRLKA